MPQRAISAPSAGLDIHQNKADHRTDCDRLLHVQFTSGNAFFYIFISTPAQCLCALRRNAEPRFQSTGKVVQSRQDFPYRASGDIEFNADGSLKPSGSCHKPFVLAISKDKLEANEWVTGAFVFDDDWDLHEYDQKIYFASEHNTGSTSAKVTANVGIGYRGSTPQLYKCINKKQRACSAP